MDRTLRLRQRGYAASLACMHGELWVSDPPAHSYREVGITRDLSKGLHVLAFDYKEIDCNARVSFDCDLDLILWNP